jgi:hypothetical protein
MIGIMISREAFFNMTTLTFLIIMTGLFNILKMATILTKLSIQVQFENVSATKTENVICLEIRSKAQL